MRRFTDGGRLVEVTGGMDHCTCNGTVGERCRYCRARLSNSFRKMEETMRAESSDRDGGTDEHGRTSYVRRIRRLGE